MDRETTSKPDRHTSPGTPEPPPTSTYRTGPLHVVLVDLLVRKWTVVFLPVAFVGAVSSHSAPAAAHKIQYRYCKTGKGPVKTSCKEVIEFLGTTGATLPQGVVSLEGRRERTAYRMVHQDARGANLLDVPADGPVRRSIRHTGASYKK